MPLASYILSLGLHVLIFLLIFFWPSTRPIDLSQNAVQISLVEGEMGGSNTPSPILGHMGQPDENLAPSAPAEQAEVAAPAAEEPPKVPEPVEALPVPKEEPKKPELQPRPEEPKVEVKKEEPKKEEKKPEPKKEEKKPEPKKEERKPEKKPEPKKETKPRSDPVKDALNQAKRKATSRAQAGDRGSSVEQALAEAKRRAGGLSGGGGGSGSGPGGGGLHSVYIGQVMLAVRPNWGYASATRQNLQCTILIRVSPQGEVQDTLVVRSSGNIQYDSSCVNAIMRTSRAGNFPKPPSPEYQNLEMVFTLNELRQG